MNNADTNNTGYIIHIAKVGEHRIGNQVWTIQTPTTLGTQYTGQRIEKIERAIKNEQSRHQQQWVHNTHNKGQRKPKRQSEMNNPDTDNAWNTIHKTTVRENRIGNQVWTIQTPTTLGTQYTEQRLEKTDRLDLGNVLTVWYSLFFICMYYHTFDISDITF